MRGVVLNLVAGYKPGLSWFQRRSRTVQIMVAAGIGLLVGFGLFVVVLAAVTLAGMAILYLTEIATRGLSTRPSSPADLDASLDQAISDLSRPQ